MICIHCINHVALTPENTKEVLNLTWKHRSRWRFIGIELGIDVNTLDAIEKDNRKAEDCLTELIATWLRGVDPKPTRSVIIKALESQSVQVVSAATSSERGKACYNVLVNDQSYAKFFYFHNNVCNPRQRI